MPTNTTELTATRKNIGKKSWSGYSIANQGHWERRIHEGTFSHSIKSARGKYIYNKEECKVTWDIDCKEKSVFLRN